MMMPNPVGLVLLGVALLLCYVDLSVQYILYHNTRSLSNEEQVAREWHESGTRLKQLHLILVQLVVFRALDTADNIVDDEL